MWLRPKPCLIEKTVKKTLVFTVFLRMGNKMLCGRLFINTWPCLQIKELSINTGCTSVEYAACMRMPVFPCKHSCCYYELRGPIFAIFITRGPEGYEGIDCISRQKTSDTNNCLWTWRPCKIMQRRGPQGFVELYHSRARLQRQRPHKTRCPDSEFILVQMLAILDCRQWVTKAKVPIAASRT